MALAMRMAVGAGFACDRIAHIDRQRPATFKVSLVLGQTAGPRRGFLAKQCGECHMPRCRPKGMVMTLGLPC